uniref:Uncharacterized protein n=1 Tax=Rhizophora mucronata TaxID=61149 RepID=A0A2P2NDS3_RHIMU
MAAFYILETNDVQRKLLAASLLATCVLFYVFFWLSLSLI